MHKPEPIAIVGMAVLLPKSPDLATYWRNILDKVDCTTPVPDDHSWSVDDQYDPDPTVRDKTYSKRGGFIDKVPFDPMEHGLTPNALDATDTSQLLSLIVAREALKDAGIEPEARNWPRERTSCVIGVTGTQELAITLGARLQGPKWRSALLRQGVDPRQAEAVVEDITRHFPEWQEQSFPGLLGNVVAGRIANRLDLGGTNCVVDAACASSLAAIQLAMGDLQTGRADLALSGGVDTLNDIFMYMCFSKTPAFSKNGDARPFDAKADGILISEGISMVVLKRLADAERDGDRVYAVIKGIGSSSDGRFKSIYAPNGAGQAVALRRAYEEAGFPLETIELVEAHGTGTKAGDAAEVEGLKAVFGASTRPGRHVAVGTVKSQIGHTKSTAGAAGLVKAAMALHERVYPPTARLDMPNPKMGFEQSKLYPNPIARPWIRAKDHPRRAGVSAFGFGGSNFHMALEEHGDPDAVRPRAPAAEQLFLFGAADATALTKALDAVPTGAPSLAHASRVVLERWAPAQAHVVGFTAGSPDELATRLAAAKALIAAGPGEKDGVIYGVPTADSRRVAVLFPGQGSQYVEMGRTAMLRHAVVRAAFDRADEHFRVAGRSALSEVVFPPPAFDDATRAAQQGALTRTEWAQPAIGALSVGLWSLLQRFGVSAEAFAGHSYGELVALHAAGVLTEESLWAASRVRGEAMADKGADRGTMAAVAGELGAIQAVLDGLSEGVVLANRNHPKQGVISGSREGVQNALAALAAAGIAGKEIAVSAAFHSSLVADAKAPFAAAIAEMPFAAPRVPVYADATAAPYPADPDAARELLARQIVSPVDFVGIVNAMWAAGMRTFVECGPKGVLAGLLKQCLRGKEGAVIVSVDRDADKADGDVQIKRSLVQLAARGVSVDVAPLIAEFLPPQARKAGSKATVWLGGPNYVRPETKNPPPPKNVYVPAKVEAPAPKVAAAPAAAPARPAAPAPVAQKAPMLATSAPIAPVASKPAPTVNGTYTNGHSNGAPAPIPAPARAPTSPPGAAMTTDPNALAMLLDSTRQSLSAFQAAQERTANVHGEFLRAHAKANDSFATLFQTHARLVELASGAPAAYVPAPVPAAHAPVAYAAPVAVATPIAAPAPAPLGPSSALRTPYQDIGNEVSFNRVADPKAGNKRPGVSDELPPLMSPSHTGEIKVVSAPVARPAPIAAPAPAARPAAPVAQKGPDVVGVMLKTVAEKTGYPQDMLELGMDMESDLGIDSIKRVEILAAVQEQVPGLPELSNDAMSALRTVGEVVDYLKAQLPAQAAAQVAAQPVAAAPIARPAAAAPRGAGPDVVTVMLKTVAEKTGYPQDMLELGMDMESDLGIDSIKRVEILAAVQDQVPGLPELSNDAMSALRTVGEVVDYLKAQLPAQAAAPVAAQPVAAAPIAAAAAAKGAGPDVVGVMLKTVAEKTGYPQDMLELGMDMESDLGIDSIKRVEILAAVQDQVPGLPELSNDAMSALRTVGEVVDYLKAQLNPVGWKPTATETAPVAQADQAPAVEIITPARREVGLTAAPDGRMVALPAAVAVTADLNGLAAKVAAALNALGTVATVVDPDWSDAAAVRAALPAGTKGVVHLAAVGSSGEALQARIRGAYLLAKAGPFALFATVSAQGGGFGFAHRVGDPLQGALAGLTKTVAQEWEGVRALALDIDPSADPARIASEIARDRGVVEVGLAGDTVTVGTRLAPVQGGSTDPVSAGDLVVVSGGARGVTAAVVVEMARRWKPALLLLGRSSVDQHDPAWADGLPDAGLKAACMAAARAAGRKPSPKELEAEVGAVIAAREVRGTLAAIRALGAEATYTAVDARNPAAVQAAVDVAVEAHGPVRGLVHGAGVIADKLVIEKPEASFDLVFGTKVDGLQALLGAVDPAGLTLFAAFGSVAGRYGNRGQCDYAMANEVLAKTALVLRDAGVARSRCFDWGPWEAGMVTPALRKHFESSGLAVIQLLGGAHAFCDELERADGPVEVVIGGPDAGGPLLAAKTASKGSIVHALSREEQRFLADHVIAGKAVLPAAMVLEWMISAARTAFPRLHVSVVRDLAVLKGVVVDRDREVTLTWEEVPSASGAAKALQLALVGTVNGRPTVHYRGVVELSATPVVVPKFPGSNGLGKQKYPYPMEEAYRRFTFHGAHLQGIEQIVGMSDHGMVAKLRTSAPAGWGVATDTWESDPLAVDSAMQMMVLWVRETRGAAALPCYLGEYVQYAPFDGSVTCHLEFAPTETASGRFDATFVAPDGRIVAKMRNAEYALNIGMNQHFQAQA